MNAGAFGGETWTHVESVDDDRPPRRGARAPARRVRDRLSDRARPRRTNGFSAPRSASSTTRRARWTRSKSCSRGATRRSRSGSRAAAPCSAIRPAISRAASSSRPDSKARQLGGAMVSDKHANFILNVGGATAADIEALIGEVRAAVERTSGVQLELEVRVIGEPPTRPQGRALMFGRKAESPQSREPAVARLKLPTLGAVWLRRLRGRARGAARGRGVLRRVQGRAARARSADQQARRRGHVPARDADSSRSRRRRRAQGAAS